MNADLTCAVEQPVASNPALLGLDEKTGEVRCWDDRLELAFRCCFVSSSMSDRTGAYLLVQAGVIESTNAHWIVGWPYRESGQFRIRSRFVQSALKHNGWVVRVCDGLGLASRPVFSADVPMLPPEGTGHELRGAFIVVGLDLPVQTLATPPFEATVRHFCWTQRLEPSRQFLNGLLEEGAIVAYTSVASDVVVGAVVVGPEALAPDVEELQARGIVSRVLRGEAVAAAWHR